MFGSFGSSKKPDDSSSNNNNKDSNKSTGSLAKSIHGFDPDSLERAAKAAKDLDSSRNAGNAIKLIQDQELTKQKESDKERAKFMAMQEQLTIQRLQESERIAQRTLEAQSRHDKSQADYRDELERKRMSDKIEAERYIKEEERRKNEDSMKRMEDMKRKTLEYEADLRQQTEIARVKAETEGRIVQERQNHDLILKNKRVEAQELRQTVLEGIKLAGSVAGDGFNSFISDREKLANTALVVSALALGIYAARTTASISGRIIEARLGKPSLVRETNRFNFLQIVKHPVLTIKALSQPHDGDPLQDIILDLKFENRLKRVITGTVNAKKNKAPFRNLLLSGPPGTGKTLFAKGLALKSGLNYAIMTGGDVTPLGKDGVTEIHKLFDWANSTNKGVLLFIDEADAFLKKRSTEKLSENLRNALNAFLYRTGESSHNIMIVYASNQPEQFDWAVNDRIDEIIEFDLPRYDERVRLIKFYLDKYLSKTSAKVDDSVIATLAKETEGFSGREISKFAISAQAAAFCSPDKSIDMKLLLEVLKESKQSKEKKGKLLRRDEADMLTLDSK